MRIGINALFMLPGKVGGSETYIRNLVRELSRSRGDNAFVLFINRESEGTFDAVAPGIKIVVCPIRAENRPLRILWEQFILPFQVRRHKLDVLLSAGMTAPFFCPATSVLVLFDLQHIKQPQNFSPLYLPFLRSIIYLSAKSADGVVTISEQAKSDIARLYHVPAQRIVVTHLGVDHDMFIPRPFVDTKAIRDAYKLPGRFLLYAASSLPHKNHERLLQAFLIVRKRVPSLKLVLIGARDQGEPDLRRKIQSLDLKNDVLLLGWLPFEHVPGLYQACDAFVYPTLHEGFGLPVIEAMACGAPVVCSRIEPLIEVAGDAALFVAPHDPAAIAEGITTAVTDEAKRKLLIGKGLERARQFTWKATAGKTLEFLKTVHRGGV
jgi:glycosyltransferase involved in cell wall biosynthesis